jgi:hypothetical protein
MMMQETGQMPLVARSTGVFVLHQKISWVDLIKMNLEIGYVTVEHFPSILCFWLLLKNL